MVGVYQTKTSSFLHNTNLHPPECVCLSRNGKIYYVLVGERSKTNGYEQAAKKKVIAGKLCTLASGTG